MDKEKLYKYKGYHFRIIKIDEGERATYYKIKCIETDAEMWLGSKVFKEKFKEVK